MLLLYSIHSVGSLGPAHTQREGIIEVHEYQEVGTVVGILEAVYHSDLGPLATESGSALSAPQDSGSESISY